MLRLAPGIAGVFASASLALLCMGAYLRHLSDGDQAGFGLGNLFLIGTFLPAAGTLLQVGAALIVRSRTVEPSAIKRAVVMGALVLGGIFFVGYGFWWCYLTWGQKEVPFTPASLINVYYIIILFAFSAGIFACLALVRRNLALPGWLFGVTVGLAILVSGSTAAAVMTSLPHVAAWPIYFMIGGPAFVWAGAHAAIALELRRERNVVPQGS